MLRWQRGGLQNLPRASSLHIMRSLIYSSVIQHVRCHSHSGPVPIKTNLLCLQSAIDAFHTWSSLFFFLSGIVCLVKFKTLSQLQHLKQLWGPAYLKPTTASKFSTSTLPPPFCGCASTRMSACMHAFVHVYCEFLAITVTVAWCSRCLITNV